MSAWVAVALLGGTVGASELVTRYRDSPSSALKLLSAWVYIAMNAGASVLALFLIRAFDWEFGGANPTEIATWQVVVAGFSALLVLRSSLFTVRVGDTDVGVGPSAMLTALLGAADRGIDRVRAVARLKSARTIMNSVPFDSSVEALLNNVTTSLQNLPAAEGSKVATAAGALHARRMSGRQKSIALGLLLLDVGDKDLLKEAVDSLDPETRSEPDEPGSTVNKTARANKATQAGKKSQGIGTGQGGSASSSTPSPTITREARGSTEAAAQVPQEGESPDGSSGSS